MMDMRILVYENDELDGIAYKETNEYVKAKEHSFLNVSQISLWTTWLSKSSLYFVNALPR